MWKKEEKNMLWFIWGLIVGGGAMRLIIWDLEGQLEITWVAWLLGILTMLLATFTIQTFVGSFQEREPRAAWMSLLFMGIPTLILAAITAAV
jgi:hypothetical protein